MYVCTHICVHVFCFYVCLLLRLPHIVGVHSCTSTYILLIIVQSQCDIHVFPQVTRDAVRIRFFVEYRSRRKRSVCKAVQGRTPDGLEPQSSSGHSLGLRV